MSDTTSETGETAEKRVRKPRVSKAAAAAATEQQPAAAAPEAPPAPSVPASSQQPPDGGSAAPPPAADNGNATPNAEGGEPRDGQQNNRFNNNNNNNRRDRFRNRRDRNRERYGQQSGLPQDGENNDNQFVPRQLPSVPEGFPQYSLSDLKRMPAQKLLDIAEQLNIHEGVARARKQDVIFALLKVLTRHGEGVAADGVLEILPDGFGFLRAAEASYLAGPDDTYISPSQIRRFNLRTGDHISGRIRWPKDGER